MNVKGFFLVMASLLAVQAAFAAQWMTDYSAGLASARQRNCAVFLFFTGSDWCGYCQALDREVLSTPQFAAFASENLVLVKIDFPRVNPLPPDQAQRNQALAHGFEIHGYPSILIINPKGQVAGGFGYKSGGPSEFIRDIYRIPTITWRGNPPPSTERGSPAAPQKPNVETTPGPAFNGAQLRAPKRFARLELNGIMGTKQRPMIMVNNQTLAPGESARVD